MAHYAQSRAVGWFAKRLPLAAAVYGCWLAATAPGDYRSAAVAPVRFAADPSPVQTPGAPPGDVAAWSMAILARPLFEPTRRPPSQPPALPDRAPAMPRLAGIMLEPGRSIAIFDVAAGQGVAIVQQGAVVAGWTVEAIGRHTVSVRYGGQVMVLSPHLAPAAGAGADGTAGLEPWRAGLRRSREVPSFLNRQR